MDLGELLTRWTVRTAMALYAASLLIRFRGRPAYQSWARWAWTLGFGAFLIHVACAFHFYHEWSHSAAYDSTAKRAEEVVGLAWGFGLYANYAFTAVWGADVCWWWATPKKYLARPRLLEWAIQGFMAFMVLNATVVFGIGVIRGIALAACLIVVGVLVFVGRKAGEIT